MVRCTDISTLPSNLRKIMLMCNKGNINSLEEGDINSLEYYPVPEDEKWRLSLLSELLDSRSLSSEIPGFTHEEVTDLINFVCTS